MPTASVTDNDFPVGFWGIAKKSVQFFGQYMIPFLLLSLITFIPFLVFDVLSNNYAYDLIEFFHGSFLDIFVFLALPTIYLQRRVFPLPTIYLFFQRFLVSAVAINCVQFGTLVLFTMYFARISIGVILIGMIPYIYLIFAGFFLIVENSSKVVSVRDNLINSIKLVRTRFFVIFSHFFLITLLTSLPFVIFFLWYMTGLPEFNAFKEIFQKQPENSQLLTSKLVALIESLNVPEFKWTRMGIHVFIRPLKSLFLSFLFLGILLRLSPEIVKSFLGFQDSDTAVSGSAFLEDDTGENNITH